MAGYIEKYYVCNHKYPEPHFEAPTTTYNIFSCGCHSNSSYYSHNCCGGNGFWGGFRRGFGMGCLEMLGGFCTGLMGAVFSRFNPFTLPFSYSLYPGGMSTYNLPYGVPTWNNWSSPWNITNKPSSPTDTDTGASPSAESGVNNKETASETDTNSNPPSEANKVSESVKTLVDKAKEANDINAINSALEDIENKLKESAPAEKSGSGTETGNGNTTPALTDADKTALERAQKDLINSLITGVVADPQQTAGTTTGSTGTATGAGSTNENNGTPTNIPLDESSLATLIKYKASIEGDSKTSLIDKLKADLKGLKYTEPENAYKNSTDYETLLKLELLTSLDPNLIVKAEFNNTSQDQWIEGPISNVQKDADGYITYNVDCRNTGKDIKATWTFKQNLLGNLCQPINATPTEYSKSFTFNKNVTYTWNVENEYWENANEPSAKLKTD